MWAWTQRYALMEDLVVDSFAEAGFEADLDIFSVSRTHATIRNIRIQRNGEEILRTEELRAQYIWPNIRNGQIEHLELGRSVLRLTLGEDWKPNADWLVDLLDNDNNTPNDSSSKFPKDGINLSEITVFLTSPLGETTLYVDANIPTSDSFDAEITLEPSAISYRGLNAQGAGITKLNRQGSNVTIEGQLQTDILSNPSIRIEDAHLQFKGTANLKSKSYTGQTSIAGQKIASALFAADSVNLNWDGDILSQGGLQAKGQWAVASINARTTRTERANVLAETLALSQAMSAVPVAEHFSPELTRTIRDFLIGADASGTGQMNYGPDGFTLAPYGPITLRTSKNLLTLTPRKGEEFYNFDHENQNIKARLDAGFTTPVGLKLTDIQLTAGSPNGIKLDGVKSFAAKLTTQSDWRTQSAEGRPIRLGPLAADMKYRGGRRPRKLSIDTNLDFDGDLPGGYVENVRLKGLLDVQLHTRQQVIDFTPERGGRITLDRLETPTSWVIEAAEFTLPPTQSLFEKDLKKGVLQADLQDAKFTLTHPATIDRPAQRLELNTETLSLTGKLFPLGEKNWTAAFTQMKYASDTLPVEGATASAAQGTLTARTMPSEPVEFTLVSPAITAETPLVRVTDMQINVSGTPDDYTATHANGAVTVIGTALADTAKSAGLTNLPIGGSVRFSDDSFVGQANLRIAKANNAETNVDYVYANGALNADVSVPSIKFEAGGLQPQILFPTLKGKIANVEGEAKAQFNIAYAEGVLTQSSGTLDLIDLDLGTAPGPIEGLNTTLTFTSLLPLATEGKQTLTMKSFNPGLVLEDGIVTYRLLPEGVGVDVARWPIGNGAFTLDPFTWLYAAEENRVTMRVEDVSLGDFLKGVGNRKVEATGTVVGVFPIVIRGVEVLVEGGKISVPDGGVLRIDPGPDVPVFSQDDAINIIRENRASEYASLARDALREFSYRELSASVNGPLDGEIQIGLGFDGANDRVLSGQPFRFDFNITGELFNIARSFNSNAQIKSEILRQNAKLPEGVKVGE